MILTKFVLPPKLLKLKRERYLMTRMTVKKTSILTLLVLFAVGRTAQKRDYQAVVQQALT